MIDQSKNILQNVVCCSPFVAIPPSVICFLKQSLRGVKKLFLEILQKWKENTCARDCFLIKLQASACDFIKKQSLVQVFSSEFCFLKKAGSGTSVFLWVLRNF